MPVLDDKEGLDIDKLIEFWLVLGETNIEPEEFEFYIQLEDFSEDKMSFILEFNNTKYVSQGYTKESIIAIILDEELIYGESEFMSISEGTRFELSLPKLTDEESFETASKAIEDSIDQTANTVVLSQLLLTLLLSVSLKQMWILLSVMQVLAFLRYFTDWEVTVSLVLAQIEESIYLTKFSKKLLDQGRTEFDLASSTV